MSYHKKRLIVLSLDQKNDERNLLPTKDKQEPLESPPIRANQDSHCFENFKEMKYIALSDEIKKEETAKNDDVVWLCGNTLPMIASNGEDMVWLGGKTGEPNSIDTGDEIDKSGHYKNDNPQVLTLSDLCDDNFDFWGTSSIKSGTDSQNTDDGTSPSGLRNEQHEMIDFDISKFVETQLEAISRYDAGTDEHAPFQVSIEKDNTLPSISSTYSLSQPWLNTFASNYSNITTEIGFQNQNESVSTQSFFEREETIGNSFTTCRSNVQENFQNDDIFKICDRTEAFAQSDENQGSNLDQLEKLFSENNKHDALKDELLPISTDESWNLRDFIEWQDNEEAEFVAGKDILTRNCIRNKVMKDNVKGYHPKLYAYRTLQPKYSRISKSSPVGNSLFFVSDSVPFEASVETHKDQVIFSCFDETSENLEIASPFTCKNVEKRKKINSKLGYGNKKHEESISTLIKEAHQKLDQAESRGFSLDEVVVETSDNGSNSNETLKTTFLQDSNGDEVELINVKNAPFYLTLSNNFGNNDANQLLFVMDSATKPSSNTCLATGELNFDVNIPSAISVNQTDVNNVQPDNKIDPPIATPTEQRMLIEHAEQNKNQEPSFSISALPKIIPVGDQSVAHKADDLFETLFSTIKTECQHQHVENKNSTFSNSPMESTCYSLAPQKADKSNMFRNYHPVIKLGKDKHAIRQTSIPLKMESPPIVLSQCKSETNDSGIDTSFSQNNIFSGTQSSRGDEKSPNDSAAPLIQLYLPLSFFTQNQNIIKTPVTVTSINSDSDAIVANGSKTQFIHQAYVKVQANVPASNNITHLTSNLPSSFKAETETSNDSKPSAGISSGYLVPLSLAASSTSLRKPVHLTATISKPLAPSMPYGKPHKMLWHPPTRHLARPKKEGRKTVRELLREKNQNCLTINGNGRNVSNASNASIVRPLLNRTCRSSVFLKPVVAPTATTQKHPAICFLSRDTSGDLRDNAGGVPAAGLVDFRPAPRPNILILPSASKPTAASFVQPCQWLGEELEDVESLSGDQPLPPFRFGRVSCKEHRPRHFELLCLQIGNFKLQDRLDRTGKSKSKLKVVFTKRLFLYEFPASQCNMSIPHSAAPAEHMLQVCFPFRVLSAMNVESRMAVFRLSAAPDVFLGKTGRRKGVITALNPFVDEDIRSCLVHKFILKNRQTAKLKFHLFHFDRRFRLLSSISIGDNFPTDEDNHLLSTFEDELVLTDLTKMASKTRKCSVRRLSVWDEIDVAADAQQQRFPDAATSWSICSCRSSCRSVRCSCVKAAQMCSTSRCLCTSCDNPLTVLSSHGISAELSVLDPCLFQNVYQIQGLEAYLCREVRLSCCGGTALVRDCLPGTVLCPNLECEAALQFSWCQGLVCYPDRNPRRHCDSCGCCRFSSGQHCPKCNKCYASRPGNQECPSCNKASKMDLMFSAEFDENDINNPQKGVQTEVHCQIDTQQFSYFV